MSNSEVEKVQASEFMGRLGVLLPEFADAEEQLRGEFSPAPIGIVSLCAGLGQHVAANFRSLSNLKAIFEVIELGMISGDDRLKDAIATGFIEALISSSDNRPGDWKAIAPLLGQHSRNYAEGWIEFTETGTVSE
jgi:hypothetical protein